MSYFSYFPNRTDYSVSLINSDLTREIRVPVTFPDFFRHVALAFPKINDGKYFYELVRVLDRERPDQLSYRLYGNDSYYWTFFILNDKLRLGEAIQWPLSYEQLTNKLEREYDGETIVTFKSRYLKSILPGLTFKKDSFLYNKFRIGEIVTGDRDALLTPPGDADALAEAIERLLDDRALRGQLGAQARRTAVERFGRAAMADRVLRLYAGLGVDVG